MVVGVRNMWLCLLLCGLSSGDVGWFGRRLLVGVGVRARSDCEGSLFVRLLDPSAITGLSEAVGNDFLAVLMDKKSNMLSIQVLRIFTQVAQQHFNK